jgi:glycosyltransferase involved in cell wall biosynthesis
MATIVMADDTKHYDGTYLDRRPLGGTESSVIRLARALVRRGHDVTVHTNCDAPVEHEGVKWRPLGHEPLNGCDLYIAVQHPWLLGFVPNARRRAIWVMWQVNHLKHYKQIGRMWRYRPVPVLVSLHQVRIYSPFLPRREPHIVIPLALPDEVRGLPPLATPPPPRAVFASRPELDLRRLVDIWAKHILPRVPAAVLDVYGVHRLEAGQNAWDAWEGSFLPADQPRHVKQSVRVHRTLARKELHDAIRSARVVLHPGHRLEAFCLAVGEAQALGVPAVVGPIAAVPERVLDEVTGFHRGDPHGFADATVALLTDDALWRRMHEAALRDRQGINWAEAAERFELALLSDRIPLDRPLH